MSMPRAVSAKWPLGTRRRSSGTVSSATTFVTNEGCHSSALVSE